MRGVERQEIGLPFLHKGQGQILVQAQEEKRGNGGRHHGDAFVAKVTADGSGLVYAGYRRSVDGGRTFSPIPFLQSRDAQIIGFCVADADTVYAAVDGSIAAPTAGSRRATLNGTSTS